VHTKPPNWFAMHRPATDPHGWRAEPVPGGVCGDGYHRLGAGTRRVAVGFETVLSQHPRREVMRRQPLALRDQRLLRHHRLPAAHPGADPAVAAELRTGAQYVIAGDSDTVPSPQLL